MGSAGSASWLRTGLGCTSQIAARHWSLCALVLPPRLATLRSLTGWCVAAWIHASASIHIRRTADMAMDSLADLLEDELKDLYSAENQLLKALPKMAKKASSAQLKAAFTNHLK